METLVGYQEKKLFNCNSGAHLGQHQIVYDLDLCESI